MKDRLPELKLLETENAWAHRNRIISFFLREKFQDRKTPVKVLEAGCGRWWPLDLGALPVELTGIDTDKDALDARVRDIGDLHRVIAADIRDVKFEPEEFDLIYSCEVLEHVKGAQEVIEKLFGWLKRDGAAVLVFHDRNTVLVWRLGLLRTGCTWLITGMFCVRRAQASLDSAHIQHITMA